MFTYFPKTKDKIDSGTGSLTAKIHNNYLYANYSGTPFVFVTNGELVALHTKHMEDLNTWMNISFNFFASIENKRYEFHEDIPSAPRPPSFSLTRFDPITGDTYGIGYSSKGNVGHIDIEEFDIDKGVLRASFNFTFEDFHDRTLHQVIGTIDVAGLERLRAGEARAALLG